MPEAHDDPARAMRHRLRNDLQTLSSLCRLAARRAPAADVAAAIPQWLNTLATLYDVPALGEDGSAFSLRAVAEGLVCRAHGPVTIVGDASAPSAALLALSLGISGALGFARNAAGPKSDIRLELANGLRAVFTPEGDAQDGKPPLGLALTAEALNGEVAITRSGRETTIALTYPCL